MKTDILDLVPGRPRIDRSTEDRFWPKVAKGESCWLWVASTNGRQGYGIFRGGLGRDKYGSRPWVLAHRFAYEVLVGPIPGGLEIDHVCRNRLCVNPAHLRVVTHRENTLAGHCPPAQQARRDLCIRGHRFDLTDKAGRRRCSTCDREKERRRYLRRYGRVPKPQANRRHS